MEAYALFMVARWAGVPIWELVKQPLAVIDGYLDAMWIENRVNTESMKSMRRTRNG
jgi:hypothetical protein